MLNQNNILFEEGNTIEVPLNLKEIYYNCTECSSPIEILFINERQNIIEFRCTKDNHLKKIPIKEYLEKIKKFNDKKINGDLCTEDNHNKKYEFFCLNCNKHLCKECLKTRNHISHNKKIIIEIQPSQKELDIIDNIIKSYDDKINNLEKEKFDIIKEIKKKLKESENKLKEKNEKQIEENKTKMENELKMKNDELLLNKQKILKEFKNEIKLIETNHEKIINEITNKYKEINDNNKIEYENKIANLNNKYNKEIKRYNYDENISNINSLKRLNEIIYNTYNMYNNNYYNSININNTLISIYNNKTCVNDDLNNEYENIIKIKKETVNNKKIDNKNKIKYNKNSKLDNINSIDISEKIFSSLIERRKLEIIHYNKKMQNDLDININDYKTFTGKYLKYETIVKEYNNDDSLIYEGEYLNRKRNGKGKEYYENGLLKYEGDYFNGKKNGKGKEYFEGRLVFEGEYSSDKKYNGKGYDEKGNIIYELKNGNGNVSEYDVDCEYLVKAKYYLKFESEYLNGERNGKGKEYGYNSYNDRLIFEGEYLNGKKNGKGKEYYWNNILKFEGEYLKGKKWNGKGFDDNNNLIF